MNSIALHVRGGKKLGIRTLKEEKRSQWRRERGSQQEVESLGEGMSFLSKLWRLYKFMWCLARTDSLWKSANALNSAWIDAEQNTDNLNG